MCPEIVDLLTRTQSDYPKANALLPECLHECHAKANKGDGCAVDDYACHCVNFEAYSKVRVFPFLQFTSSSSHPHCTTFHLFFTIRLLS